MAHFLNMTSHLGDPFYERCYGVKLQDVMELSSNLPKPFDHNRTHFPLNTGPSNLTLLQGWYAWKVLVKALLSKILLHLDQPPISNSQLGPHVLNPASRLLCLESPCEGIAQQNPPSFGPTSHLKLSASVPPCTQDPRSCKFYNKMKVKVLLLQNITFRLWHLTTANR